MSYLETVQRAEFNKGKQKEIVLKGFTLIELVIVISILAILAAVAIPRFVNMQKKATEVQEIATMAAVRSGIDLEHAKRYVDGEPNPWPKWDIWTSIGPFSVLQNPPPIEQQSFHHFNNLDGKTWVMSVQYLTTGGKTYEEWKIGCPHYTEDSTGWVTCAPGRKGFLWYYFPDGFPWPASCKDWPNSYSPGTILKCPCGEH